jgi:hypothetical protein
MAGRARAPEIKPVETKQETISEPTGSYGKVDPPHWGTVAIIGGGPSLNDFDFEQLRGATVLAVKRNIFNIPWADAGFGLGEQPDKLASVTSRVYWAVSDDQPLSAPANVTLLRRLDGRDVSTDPGAVYAGGTSGFGALQIALHKKAKQIVLFGFDYNGGGEEPDRKRAANWRIWAEHFRVFVPYLTGAGVGIVNACPHSAISCFQKVALEDGVRALNRP